MQSPHPGPLILIAERDQQVRRLQQHFLGEAGFVVVFVDDGQAALERARLDLPALLVTEILLPKLDGLALCRHLREGPSTRHVPVLVFSILAADVRAREAGASAFLRKPLVDSTFLASVRQLIAPQASRPQEERWATK